MQEQTDATTVEEPGTGELSFEELEALEAPTFLMLSYEEVID